MVAEPVIGNIHVYAGFWVGEKFWANPEQDIFNKFSIPSTNDTNLALNGDRIKKYVAEVLGRLSDCYVADVTEVGKIERFEKPTVVIVDEEEEMEAVQKRVNIFRSFPRRRFRRLKY